MSRQMVVGKVIQLTGCRFSEPNLNANKDDECDPEHDKKGYDLTAPPGIGSATPLNAVSYKAGVRVCLWWNILRELGVDK